MYDDILFPAERFYQTCNETVDATRDEKRQERLLLSLMAPQDAAELVFVIIQRLNSVRGLNRVLSRAKAAERKKSESEAILQLTRPSCHPAT